MEESDDKNRDSCSSSKAYLDFVKKRLEETDFNAEAKLKRIDELAELIFIARDNYRKQKASEDL